MNKKLVFENGRSFIGHGFGADVETVREVVFDTQVVGYQEILSDPSYCDQLVCMTYPIIGTYGLADEDYEAKAMTIGGFIVKEYNDSPSNFRYTKTLAQEMEENGIPGIAGVDTRAITAMLRDEGTMRAILTDADICDEEALRRLHAAPIVKNEVERVSCKRVWYSRTPNHKYNVVAVDCGIKNSIIRSLNQCGCNVIIVPHTTDVAEVLAMRPDGVVISNGPGDPHEVKCVVELIRALRGKVPVFGIDLGCELVALACGGKVYAMKAGHRGSNHPIRNEKSGKIEFALQNHAFAVCADSLTGTGLTVTHTNLLDGTVEGIADESTMVLAVQHHPGTVSGARGVSYLYEEFVDLMKDFMAKRGAEHA